MNQTFSCENDDKSLSIYFDGTHQQHIEWDIEWKEQSCWVVCRALINDKIWEAEEVEEEHQKHEMKICWINNTWDHNEHLWWWQQAREIDFFSLIINKQKIFNSHESHKNWREFLHVFGGSWRHYLFIINSFFLGDHQDH
jgi:hypothetical protein